MTNYPKNRGLSERTKLLSQFSTARMTLLLVAGITTFNIFMALNGKDMYFLFSASLPYYLAVMGGLLCGKFPAEFYEAHYEESFEFLGTPYFIGFACAAIAITALYFIFWLFSKKRVGFLWASLVLFIIDTVAMIFLFGLAVDMILDILLHAIVIFYLFLGVTAHSKLRKLPDEIPVVDTATDTDTDCDSETDSITDETDANDDSGVVDDPDIIDDSADVQKANSPSRDKQDL